MNPKAEPQPVKTLSVFAQNPLAIEVGNVPRVVIHDCDGGGSGIAVIIGFFPAERIPDLHKALAEQEQKAALDALKSKLNSRAN